MALDPLRIAASGMTAERLRMDVIAENLANANTTRGADGLPYRRKEVVLQQAQGGQSFDQVLQGAQSGSAQSGAQSGNGVQVAGIVADPSPLRRVYDPGNPDADPTGFVSLPNVSSVTEMVDLVTASRGYEADVQSMNATKQMYSKALDILK